MTYLVVRPLVVCVCYAQWCCVNFSWTVLCFFLSTNFFYWFQLWFQLCIYVVRDLCVNISFSSFFFFWFVWCKVSTEKSKIIISFHCFTRLARTSFSLFIYAILWIFQSFYYFFWEGEGEWYNLIILPKSGFLFVYSPWSKAKFDRKKVNLCLTKNNSKYLL